MGRHDDLGQVGERVPAVVLAFEHVETGSGEVPSDDGLAQGGFVDEATAAGVHEIGTARHSRDLGRPEQVMRLRRQRHVERDDGRHLEQRGQRHTGRADPIGVTVGAATVVDDPRAERHEPLGDAPPDLAHADDADGGVAQVVDPLRDHAGRVKRSGAADLLAGREVLDEGEHEHDRVLRHARPVHARVVRGADPGRGQCVPIDRVEACADKLDEPDGRRHSQGRGIDRPARVHEHGCIGRQSPELVVVEAAHRHHLDAGRKAFGETAGHPGEGGFREQDLDHGRRV